MNLWVGIGLFVGGCVFMFVVILVWGMIVSAREGALMRAAQRRNHELIYGDPEAEPDGFAPLKGRIDKIKGETANVIMIDKIDSIQAVLDPDLPKDPTASAANAREFLDRLEAEHKRRMTNGRDQRNEEGKDNPPIQLAGLQSVYGVGAIQVPGGCYPIYPLSELGKREQEPGEEGIENPGESSRSDSSQREEDQG